MVLHIYKPLFVPFRLGPEQPNTVQHLITIHIIRLCSLVFTVGENVECVKTDSVDVV
jgi:hypothetical protein